LLRPDTPASSLQAHRRSQIGPGGIFRVLRTIPAVVEIARDMEELCPHALLLNYANPMATVCYALVRAAKVDFIGLCHGVQTTLDLISRYVDVPKPRIDFLARASTTWRGSKTRGRCSPDRSTPPPTRRP
jgi:hypothetical protein